MRRTLEHNRTHVVVATVLTLVLMGASVVWAMNQSEARQVAVLEPAIAQPQLVPTTEEFQQTQNESIQKSEAGVADPDEDSKNDENVAADEQQETTEDIQSTLNNLNLGGWDDFELSDKELGL